MYLDFNYLLSLDALFNVCLGERGVGKTYGFKKYAIKEFIKNGKQFIYARRYKSEFDKITTFFDDMCDEFPDIEFNVKDNKFFINGEICGFYFSLSVAQQYKSMPFPNCNKILLDEFIIDDNMHHYIRGEINIFYNLCETIFRDRDFKAFLFANSVTLLNPYCLHFGFTNLPYNKKFVRNKELDAVFVYSQNKAYQKHKLTTRFGKAVAQTEFGKFANENKLLDHDEENVEKKTDCFYFCKLLLPQYELFFYMKRDYSTLWASCSKSKETGRIYSLHADKTKENVIVTKNINNIYHLKTIKMAVQNGFLKFDTIQAKTKFKPYLKLFI